MLRNTPCSLIRSGLPTLFVRRLMQCISFAGCGLSVISLALTATPGLLPAVLCLTANLTFYSLSYGGFHAYLQDVCGARAGVLQGVTNSASILAGLLGSLLTGWVVDATGSYSAVFWMLAGLYGVAAVVWGLCSSSHKLGEQMQ
jgi:ACS family sodium-dependent inorganic phosphate cotransporter